MPPEEGAAVAEPVAPAPAAQPAEIVASEPPAAAPVEGAVAEPAPEDHQSVLREFFKSIKTPEEFAAAIQEVPEEVRAPYQQEWERKGEARRERQRDQTSRARDGRLGAWKPHASNYPQAEAFLQSAVNRAKAGDPEALTNVDQIVSAINDYRNGAVAQVVLQNEAYVDTLIEKFLPDLTPDEESQLERPLYEFGRTGVAAELVPQVFELAIARREAAAFQKGVQKGLKDREAAAVLAEKVANIQKLKNESPGLRVPGAQTSRESALEQVRQEIADFDPSKFPAEERTARYNELTTKLRQLQQ